jgi:hypothetical protein
LFETRPVGQAQFNFRVEAHAASAGFTRGPSLATKTSTATLDALPVFIPVILTVDWREQILTPLGLDKVPEDRFLAQCLARLKPMQTVHKDEALAIAPD